MTLASEDTDDRDDTDDPDDPDDNGDNGYHDYPNDPDDHDECYLVVEKMYIVIKFIVIKVKKKSLLKK